MILLNNNSKRALTAIELLLVLGIITILISLVIFVVRPEDIFKQSDTVKIQNDKNDIQTAYTKYKIDNGGNTPFAEKLVSGTKYKICREEIADCDFVEFELSLNKLKATRLLKEIPIHPTLSDIRYTGYFLSDNGLSIEVGDFSTLP